MKKRRFLPLILVLLLLLAACGKEDPYEGVPDPIATITLEDGREMHILLDLKQAPNTVANFVSLAQSGFYDGLTFFRVVPGVFAQTGDPNGDGTGTPGYTIRGEFRLNGVENDVTHTRGAVSMARVVDEPDSGGSQFFLMQGSYPSYDGNYAGFGRLIDDGSYAVLDSVCNVKVDVHYRPLIETRIRSVRVDTFGYSYEPVKIETEE